jgi:hypothetical protein
VVGPFGVDRGGLARDWVGGLIDEELVPTEAGVALTALRVKDPERRPTPRWAVAVPGHQCLGSLAHDVATETDPRATGELQAEAGRSGHGTREAAGEAGRLQHDEESLRASSQDGEAVEPIGEAGRAVRVGQAAAGQVQDEQVHRTPGEQRTTDGQPFIEGFRGDDHQPLQVNAPGDGLDWIEASSEVDPGHDGARRLGLRGQPEDERRPATRAVTADRDARRARQPTGPQDGVEGREAGPDDSLVRVRCRFRPRRRFGRWCQGRGGRQGQGQGTLGDPRSCRSPASLEARHGCRHACGEGRHRTTIIDRLFY